MTSYLNTINSEGVDLNINNTAGYPVVIGNSLTSILGSRTFGASTIGAITGTSATFSTTLGVTGLITASGGLTSTAGTTTLGTSTIGAITGSSASFSSTLGVTGLATFGAGGLTSTAGTTTLGNSTIGAITGTSATFSSTLGVTGLITASGGLTSTAGTTTLGTTTIGAITGTSATFSSTLTTSGLLTTNGGLTSTSGTTTLGTTTIGAITGTSATFSSTLGVTGLATFGAGGLTSTAGTTTLGNSTIGAITGTSATFSSTLLTSGLLTANGGITSTSSTASTSNTTGGLTSAGGLGISNTTDATSVTNGGSITTAGGLAVAKKAYFGSSLNFTSNTLAIENSNASTSESTTRYTTVFGPSDLTAINASGTTYFYPNLYIKGSGNNSNVLFGGATHNAGDIIIQGGMMNDSANNGTGSQTSYAGNVYIRGGVAFIGDTLGNAPSLNNGKIIFEVGTSFTGSSTSFSTVEAMRINPGGNVGIGTNSPGYKLDVNGTINSSGLITTSGGLNSTNSTVSTSNISGSLTTSGGIGISNTTDATSITSGGSITTAGGVAIAKKLFVGGVSSFSNTIDMNTTKIINLATPTNPTDAATKGYVDSAIQGIDTKISCHVATTGPLTLSSDFENGDTIDGHVINTGERVLVKNQTNPIENGIYTVNISGSPTRASDLSTGSSASGAFTFVEKGTVNGDSGFVCSSNSGSDIVGTNGLTFVQFSSAGVIEAGTGLTKTGNTLNVNSSQTQITTIGTLSSLTLSGAITGTSASFSSTLGVTGLTTLSGGLTSTAGTTTLGASTIGVITGSSASFSSTLGVTGLTTLTGGLTSTAGTTTLGATTSTTLGVSGLITASGGLTSTAGTTTLGTTITGSITGTNARLTESGDLPNSGILRLGGNFTTGVYLNITKGGVASWGSEASYNDTRYINCSGNAEFAKDFNVGPGGVGIGYATPVYTRGGVDALYCNGNVGIGTNAPNYKLDVNGTIGSSGLITASGGLTSTAGTTTLGATTIGVITGTTATFDSNGLVATFGNSSSSTVSTQITVRNSSSQAMDVAIAGQPGHYSTSAAVGDSVIRNINNNLMLQSGGGPPAIYINTSNNVRMFNSIASSSNNTGGLILDGGLGISNTTDATSSTNGGTFTTAGGLAVAKKIFVGTSLDVTTTTSSSGFLARGATSGTVSILPQANAGTFNFNLPITAGSAGQVLASGGGGSSPTSWVTPAINSAPQSYNTTGLQSQSTPVDVTGLNYTVGSFDISMTVEVVATTSLTQIYKLTGILSPSSGWSITAIAISGDDSSVDFTISAGGQVQYTSGTYPGFTSLTFTWSQFSTTQGLGYLVLSGASSGIVTIVPQAVTGTYNYNLPTTSGNSGEVLTSAGGGSAPMTWGKPWSVKTSFSALNNQVSPVNITGLIYSSGCFELNILVTLIATTNLTEFFKIIGVQKGDSTWSIIIVSQVGDTSGVTFSITSGGQIRYTSSNSPGFTSLTFKWTEISENYN